MLLQPLVELPTLQVSAPTVWYMALLAKWPDFVVALLATLAGVYWGARLAYKGERQIVREEHERQTSEQLKRDRENLRSLIERVQREIHNNMQYVSKLMKRFDDFSLKRTVAESPVSFYRLLEWAATWSQGFSVTAYDELASSELQRLLPVTLQEDLFDARQRTVDFQTAVKAATDDLELSNYGLVDLSADDLLNNLRSLSRTACETLERAHKVVSGVTI